MLSAGARARKEHRYCEAKETYIGLAEGKTEFDFEDHFQTRKGNWKYFHVQKMVAQGYEDSLSRVYTWFTDITEQKAKEEELKKYWEHLEKTVEKRTAELREVNKQLQEQMKQRIEFTRDLIHDLKTPLVPMLGASQMLLERIQNDKLRRVAQNINRGAQKLNNSINDLVDITRGEVGILHLECKEINVIRVLNESVEFFNLEADRKRQVLTLKYTDSSATVWADEARLRQVMLNILENALKYTPSCGKIIVQCKETDNNLIVEVKDNGRGIDKDILPVLFEPYHTKNKKVGQHNGLGLGLPLAKMLIEMHNGQIWVKTRKNRGTIIGFSIPRTQ
jgi:signal transduction histidine kinase